MDSRDTTLADVLSPAIRYRRSTIAVVTRLAASRPWRGSVSERCQKFRLAHAELCVIYRRHTALRFATIDDTCSGLSYFSPARDEIVMRGRLSVVTFLHEWGHRLNGRSERRARRWSIQLFKRCFPAAFAVAKWDGRMLRAAQGPE